MAPAAKPAAAAAPQEPPQGPARDGGKPGKAFDHDAAAKPLAGDALGFTLLDLLVPAKWRKCCEAPSGQAALADLDDAEGGDAAPVHAVDAEDKIGELAMPSAAEAAASAAPAPLAAAAAEETAQGAPLAAADAGGASRLEAAKAKVKAKAKGKAAAAKPAGRQPKQRPQAASAAADGAPKPAAAPAKAPEKTGDNEEEQEHSCPGMRMNKKVSYLQRVKEERRLADKKAEELRGVVDDMLAGKWAEAAQQAQGKNGNPGGATLIRMPTPYERKNTKNLMLEKFRMEYRKFSGGANGAKSDQASAAAEAATKQYNSKQVEGLQIQGGHQYMPRPTGVKLPKDFRKPMGVVPLALLKQHHCSADRILVSVYGDIFDVSDRPDKYGAEGPYSWMSGHDLTWGFVSGKDIAEMNDQMYDMWKIAPDNFREKKLQGLLAWVAFYEYEYGEPVGRLEEYQKEPSLKGPPMEQAEECCIM